MPTPIPSPVSADSTGLADSQWVSDVRDALRDKPRPANETWTADGVGGVFGASAAPFALANGGPVYDGTPVSSWVAVTDTTASTNYTVVTAGTPTGTQVLIDYDAGTFTWATPPTAAHNIAFGFYRCKWRDTSIMTALYAGLRQMFPSVGKTYTDSATKIKVDTWDYALPVWAQSPDAQISRVEYQDPSNATEPWRPLWNWTRVGTGLLHIPQAQRMTPVAKLRITGWGPFLSLADMEPDLYHLPVWYALSVLLPKQESFRIRQDTMVPLTQEGGQQPGLLTQTGDYFAKRFDAELRQKARAYGPPGSARAISTIYSINKHV